jgi:hypothetical protein
MHNCYFIRAKFTHTHWTCGPPLFHKLGYTRFCGNWRVRISTTKLKDTFSVSSFPCKSFDNKDTLFNRELHFSEIIISCIQRLPVNATYCRATTRHVLSPRMTHSAIGSESCKVREMFTAPYPVVVFPPSLNTLYIILYDGTWNWAKIIVTKENCFSFSALASKNIYKGEVNPVLN